MEFEYDWRTRFHRPFSDVFTGAMSWREAWNLTSILVRDGSSYLGAAMAGWDGPRDPLFWVMADLYDLQHASKAKQKQKPKPYPRPKAKSETRPKASIRGPEARALLQRLAGLDQPAEPAVAGPLRGPDGRFAKRLA